MLETRNLYFITSRGEYRLLYENVREADVCMLIQRFLFEHHYDCPYIRFWGTNDGMMYDVGSHTEFFLWGFKK